MAEIKALLSEVNVPHIISDKTMGAPKLAKPVQELQA
jgi:hypothetical protein